ncbi:hypothetical protein BH10PSE19_BH10PSE19_02870 [soil metagenome]
MRITSLCLLHQSPDALLTTYEMQVKVLHLMASLIKVTIDSLHCFYLKKDLSKFDPHVGETLCQIRAYQVLVLSKHTRNKFCLFTVRNEIKRLKKIYALAKQKIHLFQTLLHSGNSEQQKAISKHKRLDLFLNEMGLVFSLSKGTYFISQAYFLTIFKITMEDGSTGIDYDKICHAIGIPKKLAKKIVHFFQSNLAKLSTEFILNLSTGLPNHKDFIAINNDLKYSDDDERIVLPCYTATKILLSDAQKNGEPILLCVKRQDQYNNEYDSLFLLFDSSENNNFKLRTISAESLETPCLIIHGVSIYKDITEIDSKANFTKRLMNTGLSNVILSNMAYHPQYSGKKLRHLSFNPFIDLLKEKFEQPVIQKICNGDNFSYQVLNEEIRLIKALEMELLSMKQFAEENGCSESNKSLFFIRHIFCGTPTSQLYMVKKYSEFYQTVVKRGTSRFIEATPYQISL